MLSHGAVVAREYGMPCVVNAAGCMGGGVRSGQWVVLDGAMGTVTVTDEPAV
jgi:phosphoenolpyruvate-protein kinase (PTS system EI component)